MCRIGRGKRQLASLPVEVNVVRRGIACVRVREMLLCLTVRGELVRLLRLVLQPGSCSSSSGRLCAARVLPLGSLLDLGCAVSRKSA